MLGIDTATRYASVGLRDDDEVIAEQTETASGSHAVSLLPLIERVLGEARVDTRDLDAIAVSRGPGSFTGLRVGLSVAKGLACATGARLVGVPTLEALAMAAGRKAVICALLDARKGEIYAGCFEVTPEGLRRLSDDAVLPLEALMEVLPTPCLIVGDAEPVYGAALRSRFGARVEILSLEESGPRGGVVAAIGAAALRAGADTEAADLEPTYIRVCEAERSFG